MGDDVPRGSGSTSVGKNDDCGVSLKCLPSGPRHPKTYVDCIFNCLTVDLIRTIAVMNTNADLSGTDLSCDTCARITLICDVPFESCRFL